MKLHQPELHELRYKAQLKLAEKNYQSSETYLTSAFLSAATEEVPPSVYFMPLIRDAMEKSDNPASFIVMQHNLQKHRPVETICNYYEEVSQSLGESPEKRAQNVKTLVEELTTAIKLTHAHANWVRCGRRIYEVHPDLSWALQRTDLHDVLTDDLVLPTDAIYLELPNNLMIPNQSTGNHPCQGAFILEEKLENTRFWRIILVGGANESDESKAITEKFGYDDAFFHYHIELSHKTVDECLDSQLSVNRGKIEREYVWRGQTYRVESTPSGGWYDNHEFVQVLRDTFRYVMNCVLYITTTESDVWFYEASKEYRDLKHRAMKAQGTKRKNLFEKLKRSTSHTRYILGSKTVIDRKRTKGTSDSTGKKITKGSMVMGHWQRYWVGEGRKQCVRKLRLPFWRGPGEEVVSTDTGRHVTKLK